MHPYDKLTRIAGPKDGMANCQTPERYAESHTRHMAQMRATFPTLGESFRLPWAAAAGAPVVVIGGKYVVLCACGDAPMASVDWDEARCFGCGAVYRGLQWPDDVAEIAAVLLKRPSAVTRSWLPGETVDDLIAQNLAHGVA